MDPVENVRRQRELAAHVLTLDDAAPSLIEGGEVEDPWPMRAAAVELAELVIALIDWRRKGGFDPFGS